MELFDTILQIILKIIFFAVLPGLIIYFKYKQKVNTGFAVGMVLTSFLLGLISASSVQPNLHKQLAEEINAKKIESAERTLKLIVQGGATEIDLIDEKTFIYPELYKQLKFKLVEDYFKIARRYKADFSPNLKAGCDEIYEEKKKNRKLNHALKLIELAELIGGRDDELKKSLSGKIADGKPLLEKLNKKCGK